MKAGSRRDAWFVGTVEIAGICRDLTLGLRSLGLEVHAVTYERHPFGYGTDAPGRVIGSIQALHAWGAAGRRGTLRGRLRHVLGSSATLPLKVWLMSTAICRSRNFVFLWGRSFLPWNLDLPVLKLLGARIIVNVGLGSEMRPPYIDGGLWGPSGDLRPSSRRLSSRAHRARRQLRRIERHADYVIGQPLSSSMFGVRPQVNWLTIGPPIAPLQEPAPGAIRPPGGPVRIAHSPSSPVPKGTPQIRAAIAELRARGHDIEFVELIGRPNAEVLAEFASCDLVVDQVFSDYPLTRTYVEAAWFGTPCVMGGYGWDRLEAFMDPDTLPPLKLTHPDRLIEAMEDLVADAAARRELGSRAQAFVRSHLLAEKVAAHHVRLLTDGAPDEWYFDPGDVRYFEGYGRPPEVTRATMREIIAALGVAGLALDHDKALEGDAVAFADGEP
ncbi:hypothetical protein [Nocardioides sp. WS12]|uniref:glycosyltransferase n=1 Tax=Nocardioides sp. WS12 TaxID=2486272 RepID=UPI0015F9C8E6|nr:hypothetical protein [Nocardioides sp. WS12]